MHEAIKITPRSCFAHLGAPVLYNVRARPDVPSPLHGCAGMPHCGVKGTEKITRWARKTLNFSAKEVWITKNFSARDLRFY